jgi:sulfate permease
MFSLLLIPFIVAMFLSINMGGSGTSPSFSAAYGADLIRKDLIPGLFGISVFFGAVLAGKKVFITIGRGILPSDIMGLTLTTIILLSVSLSMLFANFLKVPQSTSQATVFSLIGPAIFFNRLSTHKLFIEIIPTWFVLPIVSLVVTYLIGKYIYSPLERRKLINFRELSNHLTLKFFVIFTSLYVSFAIGSNNVANAAGPIVSMMYNKLDVGLNSDQFLLLMIVSTLIIAPCFGIGSSVFGYRVVQTTGKNIIEFGPLGAALISFITGTLLLFASVTRGIPTSLVQLNTGAIIGLGISKMGWREILNQASVKKLFTVWIIAPLISLILSFIFTLIASNLNII